MIFYLILVLTRHKANKRSWYLC